VSKNGGAIEFLHEQLKADKGLALAAVSQEGSWRCVPEQLKMDKGFALAAMSQNVNMIAYLPEQLRKSWRVFH